MADMTDKPMDAKAAVEVLESFAERIEQAEPWLHKGARFTRWAKELAADLRDAAAILRGQGEAVALLTNPHTGEPRDWRDVNSDPAGVLIHKTGEPLRSAPQPEALSDEALREEWRAAGGDFHGPNVETAYMPEADYFAFRRRFAQPEAQAGGEVAWRPMDTAPRDGTMLRLLVRFTEHATEDDDVAPTIGAWAEDGDPDGSWQFAGWCWTHDHFTEGEGEPIGWLPMLDTTPPSPSVDGLRELVAKWRKRGAKYFENADFIVCADELEAALNAKGGGRG